MTSFKNIIGNFCSKIKNQRENAEKKSNNVTYISGLNLPPEVKAELLAKFYEEQEESSFKFTNN